METEFYKIRKIVLDNIVNELKLWSLSKVNNWMGDAYLSKSQLIKSIKSRKRNKEEAKKALKALKALKYI